MSTGEIDSRKTDPGWQYGVADPKDNNVIRCSFCDKVTKGGIYRHKQHLVGGYRNAAACRKCPPHVADEIRSYMAKRKELKEKINDVPDFDEEVENDDDEDDMEAIEGLKNKSSNESSVKSNFKKSVGTPKQKGPMDLYFNVEPEVTVKKRKAEKCKQTTLEVSKKELRNQAVQRFFRWMYDAGLPFNCVTYDSFAAMVESFGRYGPGMKPPTYHEVRVSYLKQELNHTKNLMKGNMEEWPKYGCSLMADGWTDKRQRTLINFLVNSPKGSMFIESVDASSYSKSGEKMFELLCSYVEQVGVEYVVQVVTDSAAENVLAGKLLMAKYPHLYWTPCAAHCLDLIFEDIFKIPAFYKMFDRAVKVNGYIYSRTFMLDLMRQFTQQKEMVRPAKTRFSTAFITLKRFHVQKNNLRKLFTSEDFTSSKYAKEEGGKQASLIILNPSFWNDVLYALKVAGPLVKVLRLVHGEKKPPMGYIYEAMDRAKEAIAATFNGNEKRYKKIFEIIDQRWNIQLHRPLHAAGHYLNPEFFYSNPAIDDDEEVVKGLYDCIARLVANPEIEDKIIEELSLYKKADSFFGTAMAIRQRTTRAPADWWSAFGASTPNLKKFAIKVLSLTCSATGCERNWSIFEHIHNKKRNKLSHQRLCDLLYIKYNRALKRRYDMRDTIDPIMLDEIDDSNEWLTGRLDDNINDEDNLVFEDDSLQWGIVAKAFGVGETRYSMRSKGSKSTKNASKQMGSSSTSHQLVDEEDEDVLDDTDEEDDEGYNSGVHRENGDEDEFGDDY